MGAGRQPYVDTIKLWALTALPGLGGLWQEEMFQEEVLGGQRTGKHPGEGTLTLCDLEQGLDSF